MSRTKYIFFKSKCILPDYFFSFKQHLPPLTHIQNIFILWPCVTINTVYY